jgi:mRNA interferase RelE/StbE
MVYTIQFRPSVWKDIKRFPKRDLVKIKKRIEELSVNLPDLSSTKMRGNNTFHKIRSGDYRIVYQSEDDKLIILIIKIGHRKDIYKKLFY